MLEALACGVLLPPTVIYKSWQCNYWWCDYGQTVQTLVGGYQVKMNPESPVINVCFKVLHDSLYLLHHFLRKPVTASLSIKQTYRMVTKKYNVWYCSSLKRHILIKAFSIFLLPVPCQHVQCNSHACCKWHLSFAGQNANFSKSFLIPVPMCDGRLWILLAVRDVTPVMFRKSGLEQQSLIYRQHQVLLIGFQMHQHNIQQRQMFLVFYAFPLQNMKLSYICWKKVFCYTL